MKKLLCVVSLAALLCFTISCQNKAEKAELEKFRTQAKVEEQNLALVNREWEVWSKADLEAFKEVVAPEYVWYLPSGSTESVSIEETIEFAKRLRSAFPDITFGIEEIFAAGNRVVVRYIMRGTQQGEYAGIPATGNKIEVSGIMIHWVENGKVVEDREEGDGLGMMQQLGMELKPKEAEKK